MNDDCIQSLCNEELLAQFEAETKTRGIVDGVNSCLPNANAQLKGTINRFEILKAEILKRMS